MPPADRPVLDLPRPPLEAGLEAIALVGVLVGFAQLAVAWSGLPPVVPVHFDLSGEPDGWGPRLQTLAADPHPLPERHQLFRPG
jgi:hypothetical protein